MKLRIAKIHAAAPSRPPGYVEAVLAHGVVEGEWLEISAEALAELRDQFRPKPQPEAPPPCRAKATPPLPVMAATLVRAAIHEVKARVSGVPQVTDEEIARRMETCRTCEHFIQGQNRCELCGCFSALKSRMRSQHCPQGKW